MFENGNRVYDLCVIFMKIKLHNVVLAKLKLFQYWLLATGVGLITIHLSLVWKSNNSSLLGTSILFWSAIGFLVWEKRNDLNLESDIFSSFFGFSLIGVLLLKSASMTSLGGFLYLSPVVYAFACALLASGFKGLKQYGGELLALFILGLPKLLPVSLINIYLSPVTAKLSAFLLWYTSFDVVRSGVYIYLPSANQSIEVASGCSGLEQIFHMLGLGILFIIIFPLNWLQKLILPVCAAIVGFIVNAARVSLMVVILKDDNQRAFEYWHHGDGSLLFSTIAVSVFGLFCWFILGQAKSKNGDVTSSSK